LVDRPTLEAYTAGKTLIMDTAVGGPNMESGNFLALAEEGFRQGIITKGETLEELAKNLGMESPRLIANVEEYNRIVRTKLDPFGKSPESLVYPVSTGPFYAAKMQISNLGTLGGVRVNEKLQATDANLKPIPGLYMAGNDAAGFYGNITSYPPYEGLATGFAWNSGRIAGENAALEVKK
jgi:fumarate reductase flavoprotein subunit